MKVPSNLEPLIAAAKRWFDVPAKTYVEEACTKMDISFEDVREKLFQRVAAEGFDVTGDRESRKELEQSERFNFAIARAMEWRQLEKALKNPDESTEYLEEYGITVEDTRKLPVPIPQLRHMPGPGEQ